MIRDKVIAVVLGLMTNVHAGLERLRIFVSVQLLEKLLNVTYCVLWLLF